MRARSGLLRRVCGWKHAVARILVAISLGSALLVCGPCAAQTDKKRPVKTKVVAKYPELARRSNIAGAVKLRVVVAPNGHVKSSDPIGGNPVLVEAALDAVKHWEFEPAKEETTEVVQFTFVP